ncbi:hypothetical protein [Brachyspira catarrhinii]|uniref:Uncharacterized protein n=1 Tax=Brachyspira catarrhinii TaxID=2528966 RepID=A0ABY2TPE5_9SPIR|nr:hypothetical protein [Brachyspira catarrhinii]TKZ32777.1 hypothetical protein EZH24_09050 [Brachyspira catarrhinii]
MNINNFNFSFMLEDFTDISKLTPNKKMKIISNNIQRIYDVCGAKFGLSYTRLYEALMRYSKDIYGAKRIDNILSKYIKNRKELNYVSFKIRSSSGLMIESNEPHIRKRLAYLTYHLVHQKPFISNEIDKSKFKQDKAYTTFVLNFNEMITLFIVFNIMEELEVKVGLYLKDKEYFIHCLNNRNLSRSSLELLFESLLMNTELYDDSSIN